MFEFCLDQSDAMKDLLEWMLEPDHFERPSALDVLQSALVNALYEQRLRDSPGLDLPVEITSPSPAPTPAVARRPVGPDPICCALSFDDSFKSSDSPRPESAPPKLDFMCDSSLDNSVSSCSDDVKEDQDAAEINNNASERVLSHVRGRTASRGRSVLGLIREGELLSSMQHFNPI